uniref:hypothetical protein n=1 Tax=Paraburkholderia terrae TaxID=311230 RepID=UPI00296B2F92
CFGLEEHDLFALAATYAQGVPVVCGTPKAHDNHMKLKEILSRRFFEGGFPGDQATNERLLPANR